METVLTWVHIVDAFLLIVLVLIQSGKGAEVGFSMGSGSSQTLFGTGGGANLFTKITAVLAATFMITSLTLTYLKAKESKESVFDSGMPTQSESAPLAPPLAPIEKSDSAGDKSAPAAGSDKASEVLPNRITKTIMELSRLKLKNKFSFSTFRICLILSLLFLIISSNSSATKPCPIPACSDSSNINSVDEKKCKKISNWIATGTIKVIKHNIEGDPLYRDFVEFTLQIDSWEKGQKADVKEIFLKVGWCNSPPLPKELKGRFKFFGKDSPDSKNPEYYHFIKLEK